MNAVTAEQQVRMAEMRHQEKVARAERNQLTSELRRQQEETTGSGWAFYSMRLVPALVLLLLAVVVVIAKV